MRDYDEPHEMDESLEHQKRQIIEQKKKEFVKGCYEAYDLLVIRGGEALREASPKDIQKAINRMTQLFLIKEEYERCGFLQRYVQTHMPDFHITPDHNVLKELDT